MKTFPSRFSSFVQVIGSYNRQTTTNLFMFFHLFELISNYWTTRQVTYNVARQDRKNHPYKVARQERKNHPYKSTYLPESQAILYSTGNKKGNPLFQDLKPGLNPRLMMPGLNPRLMMPGMQPAILLTYIVLPLTTTTTFLLVLKIAVGVGRIQTLGNIYGLPVNGLTE